MDEYDIVIRLSLVTDEERAKLKEKAWYYATSAGTWFNQPVVEHVEVTKADWVNEQKRSRFLWADHGPDS